jgi:predicted ATPase
MRAIDDYVEAERSYQRAIEIARKEDIKSFELRATTRLARLWRDRGRTKAAYEPLFQVYDWFTEGFDTADLKDAKALLDELK